MVFDVQFLVGVVARQLPSCDVGDRAIVRDAEDEHALGALAAKAGKRAPNRDDHVLQQVVAVGRGVDIAGGEAGELPCAPSNAFSRCSSSAADIEAHAMVPSALTLRRCDLGSAHDTRGQ